MSQSIDLSEAPLMQNVGFLFPVIEGKIHLMQRNTEPYKGQYGPFGGKSLAASGEGQPMTTLRYPGHEIITVADHLSQRLGFEYGHDSAVREYFEEAYQTEPDRSIVSDILYLRGVTDFYKGIAQNLQMYLAKIGKRTFNPSAREVGSIKTLDQLSSSDLYPLAMVGLIGMLDILQPPFNCIPKAQPYQGIGLEGQIKPHHIDERVVVAYLQLPRRTSVIGAMKLICGSDGVQP